MDKKRFDGPPSEAVPQFDARGLPLSVGDHEGESEADTTVARPEPEAPIEKAEEQKPLNGLGDVQVDKNEPPKRRKRGRGNKPKQSTREQPTAEIEATKPGLQPTAEENQAAEAEARRERLETQLEELEVSEEAYEEAKDELTKRVKELRTKVRRRELADEELKRETERMVSGFKETQAGAVLKKLLPDRVGAAAFSDKLRRIVEMALNLPYWSQPGFNQRYRRKFGSEIVSDFNEQERSLMNDLLDATAEEEPDVSSQAA